ncbi:serine/threonine-protein kinase [Nostoc sp.]|uniref:serine/threonine-protein kinase n=1 Tax=Nostoc sp. TaxID=1180 RepID=UPI002FFD539C
MEVKGTLTYEKLKQIGVGQGCNSQVFLINESQLGGVLVAKEVAKDRFNSVKEYFQESKAIFASKNPNVVSIHYACETDDNIVLVMPYFNKGSLSDRLCQNCLPLKEVIRVAQSVLNGLHHIHIKKYLHLDIKPSNILFSDTDEPMIADFGQSGLLNQNGVLNPPPMYIFGFPPEVFKNIVTIESDIYLMGVTLYRAINGDMLFNNQKNSITSKNDLQNKIETGQFPDRNSFMPHVPKSIRRIIKKALNIDPKKRYTSAIELADTLGKVAISLDWNTQISENGEIFWRASQGKGKPDLVVELVKDVTDSWNVSVYTVNQGTRRKKSQYCSKALTHSHAETHLEKTFAALV